MNLTQVTLGADRAKEYAESVCVCVCVCVRTHITQKEIKQLNSHIQKQFQLLP